MKKIMIYISFILFLVGCDGETIYKSTMNTRAAMAQLTLKTKTIAPNLNVSYYENNVQSAETVVLIHGFRADKEAWLQFAHGLQNKYHIVIPDLIGYGESSKPMNLNYSLEAQAKRLKTFLSTFPKRKLVLIGNSMGGGIVVKYASQYQVDKLVLVDAMGVKGKKKSNFDKLSFQSKEKLLYNLCTRKKFKTVLDYFMEIKPYMPGFVMDYLVTRECRNDALARYQSQYIYHSDLQVQYTLLEESRSINVPTLIAWGAQDRVLDPSNAYAFNEAIENSEVKIYNGVGHVAMQEIPYIFAFDVLQFLAKN